MIRVKNAGYLYSDCEQLAIKNINLQVAEHEFLAVMGRNGSGKSTLTRLLNGLLIPDSGSVEVDGLYTHNSNDISAIREKVGLLFPVADNQLIAPTVEEDVAFGPENLSLPPEEIRKRVDTALRLVSMEDYKKYPPNLLSGGQKQKVCIAGLLAMKPQYLVLDEPGSMLDVHGRRELIQTFLSLYKNTEISIIMVTHDLVEAVKAERIIVLDKGEIILDGKASRIAGKHEKLLQLGIEPLEISSLIKEINNSGCVSIKGDILEEEKLVEELCQLW